MERDLEQYYAEVFTQQGERDQEQLFRMYLLLYWEGYKMA